MLRSTWIHGDNCACHRCAPDVVPGPAQRQAIPIVKAAGILQPPTRPCRICGASPCDPAAHVFADAEGPSAPRTYDEMMAAARAAVAKFERNTP